MEKPMTALANDKPKKAPWGNKPIDSLGMVIAGINYLDMPTPSRESIVTLFASDEKPRFKLALEECLGINGAESSIGTKRYLFAIVSCLSEEMRQSLDLLGYTTISVDTLIYIGANVGLEFRKHVSIAIDKSDPNYHQNLTTIETILQKATTAVGADPIKLPGRPRPVASQQTAARQPEPREPDSTDQPIADSGDDDKGFLSTHVYGGKSALCFNASLSQNKQNHTIILDAALVIGTREYDWKNAIKIQLGHKELPMLLGVLLGWKNSVKFDAHGSANDKCFEIERQDGKFFAKVFAKGKTPCALPMTPQDAYPVAMIVLSQILKQVPTALQSHPEIVIQMMKMTQVITPVA
jgi:hypothetical protein